MVDDIVEVVRPEPRPDRFAGLYGLLGDKLKEPFPPASSKVRDVRRSWSSFLPMVRWSSAWPHEHQLQR